MNIERKTLRNIFLGAAGCILFYWLLFDTDRVKSVWNFISAMISPFVIGAGIAFILNVPMHGIEKKLTSIRSQGLRRLIALLLTFVAISFVLFVVFWLLLPQVFATVEKVVSRLPGFGQNIWNFINDFLAEHPELLKWVQANTEFEQINWSNLIEKLMDFLGNGASNIVGGVFSVIGSFSSGVFDGVIGFVFALYCLFRKEILARQAKQLIYALLPERFCDGVVRVFRLTSVTFSNFISGQCLEACILGAMFAVCMLIFRMPYIPLISVLIAVAALVPIIGAFVGCILGGLFILVDGDPMKAVWFVIMFLIVQQFEGNVIYPKVVGKSVGLPGMWVLVAVTVGGALMGVPGMFIMIPLFSVAYTLLREFTSKRIKTREIDYAKIEHQSGEDQNLPKKKRKRKKNKDDQNKEEQSS